MNSPLSPNRRPDLKLVVPEQESEGNERLESRARQLAGTILGYPKRFYERHLALVKPEVDRVPWERPGFVKELHQGSLEITHEMRSGGKTDLPDEDRRERAPDSISEPKD